MSEKEDFVDVSVKNLDKMEISDLTPEQLNTIKDNPEGLTREGAEHQLWLWMKSNNKYMKKQYLLMLKHCKTFANSGKTVDGKDIFTRVRGRVTSYGDVEQIRKDLKFIGVKY